jgi:hypothetical protein
VSERLTLRLDASLRARLSAAATAQGLDLSTVVRQAVTRDLDHATSSRASPSNPPSDDPTHTLDECAYTLVQCCVPEIRQTLLTTAEQMGIPPWDLLVMVVTAAVWPEGRARPSIHALCDGFTPDAAAAPLPRPQAHHTGGASATMSARQCHTSARHLGPAPQGAPLRAKSG